MALNQLTEKPGHVPEKAVFDFDFRHDEGLIANPHRRVLELLDTAPKVFWTPRNGGAWVALGFEEVSEALRQTEVFSSSMRQRKEIEALMKLMPDDMPRIPQLVPVSVDPPVHTEMRKPLAKAFSPKSAMKQMDKIRELTDQLIDAVVDQKHCEFISAIAEPLPVTVFLDMMGLPVERLAEFRELVHEVLIPVHGPDNMPMMLRKVADTLKDDILARKDDRRDDILSALWGLEVDGKPMTMDLMEDYAVLLFIAGLDTVINAMGYAVRHLAENPDLQASLRADPSQIPDAVEEMLRRYSFVVPMRRVAEDTQLGGFGLKEGDQLVVFLAGAGLDERKFENPTEFDLSRDSKAHLAFGGGVHRCVGMHLARIELQTVYRQMLSRLPTWRLDPAKPPKYHAGNVIAVDELHIRWD
ncbi:MAG: cytochrome P450 [Sphingomonadaceae bacterium]|nr:cytochrome P450 [Sphingomonadaceae bacterium]